MRIAFFSDVHGNLPALKAVLGEIEKREADAVVFLGDLVHYGPQPEECAELLRNTETDCIQGNCDRAVARKRKSTGEGYENPHWTRIAADFLRWTSEAVSAGTRKWLKDLPDELRFQAGKKTVHCVHGLPGRQSHGLPENAAAEVYDAILNRSGSDILACGLTHTPSIIRRPDGLIINPGSIGGGTLPSGGTFMILSFPEEGHPEIETVEFYYGMEELERAYEAAGTGELFLKCLKLGRDQRGNWHTDQPKWRQQWAEL